MTRALFAVLCIALGLLIGVGWARAEVGPGADFAAVQRRFSAAQEAYSQGDYRRVIELVSPLVYPQQQLATMDQAIDAYRMLGVSYVFEKKPEQAEQAFLAILAERPSFSLDPLVDPTAAIELFTAVKRRNAQVLTRIEANQRAEELRRDAERRRQLEADRNKVVKSGSVGRKSYVLNYVPFGAGQLQNGESKKGWFLFGSELLLGATSLGCSLALRLGYPSNHPPAADRTAPDALNITQVTTGVLFWTTVLYGIADALVHYRRADVARGRSAAEEPRAASVSIAPWGFHVTF